MDRVRLGYGELLLLAVVLASTFNIVPLVLAPIVAFIFMTITFLIVNRDKIHPLNVMSDVRWVFIAYLIVSFLYAGAIGVNLFKYELYRREFKYFLPFAYFISLVSLRFRVDLSPLIIRALLVVSLIGLLWLLISLAFPNISIQTLYTYTKHGTVWEKTGSGPDVYLGTFLSHSAAGGFYSTLVLYLIAVAPHSYASPSRVAQVVAVIGALMCFYFTLSRAYAIALMLVCALGLMRNLVFWRRRMIDYSQMKNWLYLAAIGVSLAMLSSAQIARLLPRVAHIASHSTAEQVASHSTAEREYLNNDARLRNVSIRFGLWKEAFRDFQSSPLVGVGVTRFDDTPDVLETMDRWTLENVFGLKMNFVDSYVPRYLLAPMVRINVSREEIHTDQHAHNVYLHVLAEGGVLLFLLFVAMYWSLIHGLWKIVKNDTDALRRDLALGSIMGVALVAIASVFGNNLLGVIPLVTILSISGYLFSSSEWGLPVGVSGIASSLNEPLIK